MPITVTFSPAPSRREPGTFSDRGDSVLSQAQTAINEANALEANVNAKEVSAVNAAASAEAAAASMGAPKWVSGATYAIGDAVWSPITYTAYRRKTAGDGVTDPSADTTNWASIGVSTAANTFTGLQTMPSVKITTGAGLGKVLSSDADGDASWVSLSGKMYFIGGM